MTVATRLAYKVVRADYRSALWSIGNGLVYEPGAEVVALVGGGKHPAGDKGGYGIFCFDTFDEAVTLARRVDPVLKERHGVRIVELEYAPEDLLDRREKGPHNQVLRRCRVVADVTPADPKALLHPNALRGEAAL